jgi:hypothetical protein
MIYRLDLHKESAASLVSVGCSPTTAASSFSQLNLMLGCSWYPHEWCGETVEARPLPTEPKDIAGGTVNVDSLAVVEWSVTLSAHSDPVLWNRRFRYLNMKCLHAHHDHGVPTTPALPGDVKNVSCDSCLLHKANVAPRNSSFACPNEVALPLMNMSSDI